jgi:CTP:molybdopterin cytidylyltransferase MocA
LVALTVIIVLILAPIVALTAFFALEVFAGLRPSSAAPRERVRASAVIVIPAHDEEAVIAETVSSLLSQGAAEILVVADNCADRTAEAARRAGAGVVVRDHPQLRGKGFALAAARDRLRSGPPDVVVILDADCRIDRPSLAALIDASAAYSRPCQATNLLAPDLAGPPMVQISNFAFMIKNLIRQRGLQRIADRAHLTGTGMSLPWQVFEVANLGGSDIVEDLSMGVDLADRVARPLFVEQASVWSPAASAGGTLVQRQRWEGGYLATARKVAPAAFIRSIRRGDIRAVFAAVDLAVPPLALLVLLNGAGLLLAVAAAALGAASWPIVVQVAAGLLAGVGLMLAWVREGQRFVSAGTLARLPLYVLWKLPLYLGLVRRGAPKEWLRTGR